MKDFSRIDLLLITSSDIGAYAAVGALCVATISVIFNRLGSLLKDKGESIAISTKLDRALQDIEKNEDDIKALQHDLSRVEVNVEHLNNTNKHKDPNY